MAIFDYTVSKLTPVQKTTFMDENILERKHIQAALKENIAIISSDYLVMAEEFSEWKNS